MEAAPTPVVCRFSGGPQHSGDSVHMPNSPLGRRPALSLDTCSSCSFQREVVRPTFPAAPEPRRRRTPPCFQLTERLLFYTFVFVVAAKHAPLRRGGGGGHYNVLQVELQGLQVLVLPLPPWCQPAELLSTRCKALAVTGGGAPTPDHRWSSHFRIGGLVIPGSVV